MSDQPIKLDSLSANELDAIREVASIGSGHSVSALSDLLGKNIQMEVPNVRVVPMESVAYSLLDEESRGDTMCGLFVETEEEMPMDVVILMSKKTILFLLSNVISDTEKFDVYNLNELEISTLKEIGNILILQYISALETFTGITFRPKFSPVLTIDLAEAIVNSIIMKSGDHDQMLVIENKIFSDMNKVDIMSLLIPSEIVLDRLIKRLFL